MGKDLARSRPTARRAAFGPSVLGASRPFPEDLLVTTAIKRAWPSSSRFFALLLVLASFFLAYMASKTWRVYQVILVWFVFAASMAMVYLSARTLKTHQSWRSTAQAWQKAVDDVERENASYSGGGGGRSRDCRTGNRPAQGRIAPRRGRPRHRLVWRPSREDRSSNGRGHVDDRKPATARHREEYGPVCLPAAARGSRRQVPGRIQGHRRRRHGQNGRNRSESATDRRGSPAAGPSQRHLDVVFRHARRRRETLCRP